MHAQTAVEKPLKQIFYVNRGRLWFQLIQKFGC